MKTKFLSVLILLVSNVELSAQAKVDSYIPIPVSTKQLDIPVYETGREFKVPYAYWRFAKQKEMQLGLRSPEKDTTCTTFRVWITNPVGTRKQPHGLIEVTKDNSGWKGKLTFMSVNYKYKSQTEVIARSKTIELRLTEPEWVSLMDTLMSYKIAELPTDDKIPDYYSNANLYSNNEPTYSFEYATPNSYRFFQYSNIYRSIDNFWQAQHVEKILTFLDEKFNWNAAGKEFFRSN